MSVMSFFYKIKFTTLVLVMVVVTVLSTFALSYLITDEINVVSEDIAKRNFREKYDGINSELKQLESFLDQIETISERAGSINELQKDFERYISFLPEAYKGLITWEYPHLVSSSEIAQAGIHFKNDTMPEKTTPRFFTVLKKQSEISPSAIGHVWRNKLILGTPDNKTLALGYGITLSNLQKYFANVDSKSVNYAYVFNKDGLCILHPDETLLGENVFSFKSITPKDTIGISKFSEKATVVQSEYLQLDVIRYLKPLTLKNAPWYISVSTPKSISEENVTRIREYTFIIYGISTVLLIFVVYFFNQRMKKQFIEKERLLKEKNSLILQNEISEKESSFLQLQQLKEQINPHFLFNALNSLYMLIDVNQEKSKVFALKLSKLYRYFITPPKNNITIVEKELALLNEYIYLQDTRFNGSLLVSIIGDKEKVKNQYIPFLALQTLVENAIKHNTATKSKPLSITVSLTEKGIEVKNSYQPITTAPESHYFGIDYLKHTYAFYNVDNFENYQKDGEYFCFLPFIVVV
ncbi:histidine kinase [Bizionia paragorgiae]|uniref:Histidine kinase n=1 Tax=Bizionia paragorgiae TaxID=283786 RepID=A0A1H3VVP4_BIZPA|nr:histidine kinase [Bizionia paragorgiae]SDZ78866.1 Histidine kinase [Bizionia paragorgiae]